MEFGAMSSSTPRRPRQTLKQEAAQYIRDQVAELPDRLDALIGEMRETDDPREQDRLNYEFHRTVNRGGISRRLNVVLRILSTNMPTHFFEYNLEWQQHVEAEHRAIVDAIRDGDGDAAASAVADHFRHIGEQAVHSLTKAGFWNEAGPAPGSAGGTASDG